MLKIIKFVYHNRFDYIVYALVFASVLRYVNHIYVSGSCFPDKLLHNKSSIKFITC